ncbi:serine hydrolase [Streptacidiphilus anmyonensis]|uniref:serine hydrolase n=1 Tax=Streptacidiphilus anmyonensis TaxID=405782 RepID=UPI0005A963E0|nr:serine hydrolase [Streptacidiphilus anmyonensis]
MLTRPAPPREALPGTIAVCVPGHPELERNADEPLPLASVGKLLLLAEVAHALDDGSLDADHRVDLRPEDYCGGSGLLTVLSHRRWTVSDLARLTAAVSDNTATNALLRVIGLDRVNARAQLLGLERTRLLDRLREPRLAHHAPTFAVGTARELAALARRIAGDEPWARPLLGWMAACCDRSMVPALIPHDPEDSSVRPVGDGAGLWVANKTGTDSGTRCDVGVVRGRGQVCYAVLASCPAGGEFAMVQAMRALGPSIAEAARQSS